MSSDENCINLIEFNKGIQMIITAFKEQKEQYLKIIDSMKQKIYILEEQIKKLKEENTLCHNKFNMLQKNIKFISKTIYQLREDEIIENKNYIYNSSKNFFPEKNIKNNRNEKIDLLYKRYNLNKLGLNKDKIIPYRNLKLSNSMDEGNNNDLDNDIKINRKQNNFIENNINDILKYQSINGSNDSSKSDYIK